MSYILLTTVEDQKTIVVGFYDDVKLAEAELHKINACSKLKAEIVETSLNPKFSDPCVLYNAKLVDGVMTRYSLIVIKELEAAPSEIVDRAIKYFTAYTPEALERAIVDYMLVHSAWKELEDARAHPQDTRTDFHR